MKVINPSFEIITPLDGLFILKHIEEIGRVCYKSEHRITKDSCFAFAKNIIARGHEAVFEHESFSVRFLCDRGISHELVRHRLASFCQESTRYCNYAKDDFQNEITVIEPCFLSRGSGAYNRWYIACMRAETTYFDLLDYGCAPQEARAVLPTCLKTEVVMTANIREWRHFLKLRTAWAAHPQMRELTIPLLKALCDRIPVLFDDIREDVRRESKAI